MVSLFQRVEQIRASFQEQLMEVDAEITDDDAALFEDVPPLGDDGQALPENAAEPEEEAAEPEEEAAEPEEEASVPEEAAAEDRGRPAEVEALAPTRRHRSKSSLCSLPSSASVAVSDGTCKSFEPPDMTAEEKAELEHVLRQIQALEMKTLT